MKIGIINYEMGNIFSVYNVFRAIGCTPVVVERPESIKNFSIIILPGVGSFPQAIKNLKSKNLIDEIKRHVLIKKKPIIGICLGMQLFLNKSYENEETKGLSFIKGEVKYIKPKLIYQTPIVGWKKLIIKKDKNMFKNIDDGSFYFDHSYECKIKNKNFITSKFNNGNFICSSVRKKNIIGFQFHPEKSQKNGVLLLKNLIKLCGKLI